MEKSMTELTYILNPTLKARRPITLNLFEAEFYEAAVVVQPLIGTLIYASNHGEDKPCLAESWERITPCAWRFLIKSGFRCDNGENITPISFKKSLERTIRIFSAQAPIPILAKLEGFMPFIRKECASLEGIKAIGNHLEFRFQSPVDDGLIQILSWSPFGFICAENFSDDGAWLDDNMFVASGPYRIKHIENGKNYVLEKRKEWVDHQDATPDIVRIGHQIPTPMPSPIIIDTRKPLMDLPDYLIHYPMAQEYLGMIVCANLRDGFFADIANRQALREKILSTTEKHLAINTSLTPAFSFFANAKAWPKEQQTSVVGPPKIPLVINGSEPAGEDIPVSWKILNSALDQLSWAYSFAGAQETWKNYASNEGFDLKMIGPSIGCIFQGWNISMMFNSEVGGSLPDPTGSISKLCSRREAQDISEIEMAECFEEIIFGDSAIIPVGRFGMHLYASKDIDPNSIGNLMRVMKFEDLKISPTD